MKARKILLAITLIVSIAAGNVIGVTAAGSEHTTDNIVGFEAGGTELPPPVDPEEPDIEDPDPEGPDKPDPSGPLSLILVPVFDFGVHEIAMGDKRFDAALPIHTNNGNKYYRPHSVQVADLRGSGEGWQVTAKFKQPFTNTATSGAAKDATLDGAAITIKNVNTAAASGSVAANKPATDDLVLQYQDGNANTVTVVEATEKYGMGTTLARFGRTDDIPVDGQNALETAANSAAGKSVTLSIPKSTQVYAGTYTASIVWTLTEGVGNN